MTCLSCEGGIEKVDALPEDIRPDGTLPVYGTCRTCRRATGRGRGYQGATRFSAPEAALYKQETQRRAVVVVERTPAGDGTGPER